MRRFLDWRFLVALMCCSIVAYLIGTGVQTAALRERSSQRADRLAAALQESQATNRDALRAYTSQRRMFLRNQAQLLDQLERVQRQQRQLVHYVRTLGIEIPPTVAGAPEEYRDSKRAPADRKPRSSGSNDTPKSGQSPHPAPTPQPSEPEPPSDPLGDLLHDLLPGGTR